MACEQNRHVPLPEADTIRASRATPFAARQAVKLDDPSFNAPIYANLFDDEDGEGYTLIWSRGRKANGD